MAARLDPEGLGSTHLETKEAWEMSNLKVNEHLVSFRDGSYKKVTPVAWSHGQWIHYRKADGSVVRVNPANVNYIEQGPEETPGAAVRIEKEPGT